MKKIFLASLALALIVGCASKKAKQDEAKGSIDANQPMNFDPQGSDSQKINGLNSIHFPYDKATFDATNKDLLQKNADWLKAHPDVAVQIEGHCDLKGSIEYNLALGERRAKAAQAYLLTLGVKADQMSTVSYGKEKPLTTDESDEAQAKNRRDNFVPLKK